MLRSGAIRGRAREKGRQETAAAPRPVPSRATSSQLPGAAAMAAQLRAEAAAPAARLGPKVRPVSCTLLTFFLLAACSIHETEQKGYCENIITKKHLDKLQELIDSQMLMSCHVSFEFIDEQQLGDPICFVKAAFPRLEDILDKMKFKKNSDNFNKTKDVQNMYKKIDENEVPCIDDQDDHERELSQACSKEFFMPPEKMLQLVKNFFHQVMVLLDKNVDFKRDCSKTYQKCSATKKEVPSPGVVTDRDCNCPSPSPPREGLPASSHPALASKPFPSTVPRLGSKEAAASTHLAHSRPGAMQSPVKLDSSTKPRVSRSTHRGLVALEMQGVWAGISASVSSPTAELELASASQGLGSGSIRTEPLLDLTEPPSQEPRSTEDIFTSPSSLPASGEETLRRKEIHRTRTEAEQIQAWPTGLRLFLRTTGSADSSPGVKQTQPRAGEDVTQVVWAFSAAEPSTHLIDPRSADAVSSPALTSEAVEASGADPSGRFVTPLHSELWPIPSVGSKEPISVVQHRFSRMSATTDRPPAPETPPGGSPRHPAGQGKAPDVQRTTELRGKRTGGLPRFRELDDSLAGPIPDLNILPPNTDQRRKEAQPKETQREVMSYVLVAVLATVAILLAVGGLLFYKHRSRTAERSGGASGAAGAGRAMSWAFPVPGRAAA
ncbi:macrophage colony-stimulating factor 1 isoform X2 [Dermochelys coriacea]|uniref:macrophage colony-stimulating factor 1 isoform X2 n=1 Tax=Dermochelys coriacea TaxID=27794 RepID=UPI001CA7F44A|nr:macrophage colony-stimulating factor 1 isoform X2 [Dermochelys coriacea]